MRRNLAVLTILLGLLGAACGGTDDTRTDPPLESSTTTTFVTPPVPTGPTSTTTTTPPVDERFILQITDQGGFAPIESLLNRVPRYTLYEDGTLYSPGAQIAIFPGPMLPAIQVGNVGTDGVAQVLALIEKMGLPGIEEEYDDSAASFVADATTTVAQYVDDTGDHIYGVYALGLAETETATSTQLIELLNELDRLAGQTPAQVYEGDRLQIHIGEPGFEPDGSDTRPWPLGVRPDELEEVNTVWRCGIIEGRDATEALMAFGEATQATLWELEGVEVQILARPLFPGEPGCEAGLGFLG